METNQEVQREVARIEGLQKKAVILRNRIEFVLDGKDIKCGLKSFEALLDHAIVCGYSPSELENMFEQDYNIHTGIGELSYLKVGKVFARGADDLALCNVAETLGNEIVKFHNGTDVKDIGPTPNGEIVNIRYTLNIPAIGLEYFVYLWVSDDLEITVMMQRTFATRHLFAEVKGFVQGWLKRNDTYVC